MPSKEELRSAVRTLRPNTTPGDVEKLMQAAVEDRIWNELAKTGPWEYRDEMKWGDSEAAKTVEEWIQAAARTVIIATAKRLNGET